MIPARAGIHGANHYESGRKSNASFGPRNIDETLFQRLTQRLYRPSFKLRKFVQKQNSPMAQGYFSRFGINPSANQSHVRRGVVRTPKRPLQNKIAVQRSGDA